MSPDDDYLHAPTSDDRWWSETYWFSYDVPERGLSGHFYPMVRRNLDLASLKVTLWSADADSPWTAPYFRTNWHLPAPSFDGDRLSIDYLTYEILEPMRTYRVRYDDPGRYTTDLVFDALSDPFEPGPATTYQGHIDQFAKVTGTIVVHGETIAVDSVGIRDRSWGPRSDERNDSRAYYFFGVSGDRRFLVIQALQTGAVAGFYERDGVRGRVVSAVLERTADDALGRLERAALLLVDEHGRELETVGRTRNHFAMQANPHQFSWISMIAWDADGMIGQFQEVVGRNGLLDRVAARFRA